MRNTLLMTVALALLSADAAARDRVAIIPLSATGQGAARVASATTRGLVKSLRRARKIQPVLMAQRRAAKLHLCLQEPQCVRSVASSLGVALLLTGHVDRQGDSFHLDLRVVSGQSGEVVGSESVETGQRGVYLPVRAGLVLLAQARSGVKGVKIAAATSRDRAVDVPVTSSFSRIDAEYAAALVEARDTEDPLQKKVATSQPAKHASGAALPAETIVLQDTWTGGHLLSRRYAAPWTLAGIGLAALGTGVGFGVVSSRANSEARASEAQPMAWLARDKARKNALVANICYGVGGAAALTSAIWFIVEYRKDRAESRQLRRIQVGLDVAQGGGAVTARGEF